MQASQIAVTAQWAEAGEFQIKFRAFSKKIFLLYFWHLTILGTTAKSMISLQE